MKKRKPSVELVQIPSPSYLVVTYPDDEARDDYLESLPDNFLEESSRLGMRLVLVPPGFDFYHLSDETLRLLGLKRIACAPEVH